MTFPIDLLGRPPIRKAAPDRTPSAKGFQYDDHGDRQVVSVPRITTSSSVGTDHNYSQITLPPAPPWQGKETDGQGA